MLKFDDIRDTTPQSINKLNSILRGIVSKVTGGLDFIDFNSEVKEQLFTYPLQFNQEGNLDNAHPLYVRFYVPADAKKIKSASINAVISNYRMDSGIAASDGTTLNVSGSAETSKVGGQIYETLDVDNWWGYFSDSRKMVTHPAIPADNIGSLINLQDDDHRFTRYFGGYVPNDPSYMMWLTTPLRIRTMPFGMDWGDPNETFAWLDYALLQHKHKFKIDWFHSHNVNLSVQMDGHYHKLEEKIKESSTAPTGVNLYINDNPVGNTMSGGNAAQNNIDISEHVALGQWNTIKVTSSTVARITIYGIIEITTRLK